MRGIFEELKRRNVFRVGFAYVVVGWLVVQVVNNFFPALNLPGWTQTFIAVLILIGFPFALLFAWAFELTPEGVKKTAEVDADDSITPATDQKLNYVIGAALVAALGFIAWQNLGPTSRPEARQDAGEALVAAADKSIAVLPFVSMSSGEDDGYFADGLTEELMNSLAQIKDLKVAGRTSSFYYKGKTPNFQEVGKALGVAHILEGSVRRSGDTIRVTAQLIRADNGFHLWSETFDRASSDIFAIQDDIAKRVTEALKVTLLGEEAATLTAHGTTNAEAQSLYLIATARLRRGPNFLGGGGGVGNEHLRTARRLLEQVVGLDPAFAEAWAELSRAYRLVGVNLVDNSGEALNYKEALRLSGEALEKAMALAPDLPQIRLAEAEYLWNAYSNYFGGSHEPEDKERALTAFDEVLALEPANVAIIEAFADTLAAAGKFDHAISLYDRALALDPLSEAQFHRALAVFKSGRLGEARADFMRLGEVYPESSWRSGIATIEFERGHFHHGILWSNRTPEASLRSLAWASLGNTARALEDWTSFDRGGDLSSFNELTSYYFKRDYKGLRDWLAAADGEWVAREQGAAYLRKDTMLANIYLREWATAIVNLEAYFKLLPNLRQEIYGESAGRSRVLIGGGREGRISTGLLSGYVAYSHQENDEAGLAGPLWDWAQEVLDSVEAQTPKEIQEVQHVRALFAAGQGNVRAALEAFEKLYDDGWRWRLGAGAYSSGFHDGDMGWFEDSPLLDSIRDEPRFIALVEKVKAANAAMLAELNAGLTLEDIMDEK